MPLLERRAGSKVFWSPDDCITIANFAIQALKAGYTSREIEKAIRKVRLAPPGRSRGGPGRVFHADGRSVLKVQTGLRNQKIATQTDRKTLPSREASRSVLCSDSICSKTAPIALNALRIEPKYLYNLFFHIQLFDEYIMGSRRMSTTFYGSKAISAGCNRTDWKFQQNAKYDEISERKTRVIYLCLAEGKKAGLQSLEQEA